MGPAMLQSCQLRIIKRNSCFIRLQITCTFYYIKANEIPGELSHENIISLHVKIKCYLYVWKDHLCIGYIISDAFVSENEMVWDFIGISCVKKEISLICFAHLWNIFQHLKINFISPHSHIKLLWLSIIHLPVYFLTVLCFVSFLSSEILLMW